MQYAAATPSVTLIDAAVLGSTLNDVINRRTADIALIGSNPGKGKYIYSLMIGANDGSLLNSSSGVTSYVSTLATHLDAVKAGGFTYVVVQTTCSGGIPDPYRGQLNTAIQGLVPAHANAVVNVDNIIMGWSGCQFIRPLYYVDDLHPSTTGHGLIEPLYASVMNSLLAGTVPTPIPDNPPPTYPATRPNTFDNLQCSPGPQLAFSNGNLTVVSDATTGAGGLVRTMIGKLNGKWAAEFRLDGAGPFHQMFGICDESYLLPFLITGSAAGQGALGLIPNSAGYSDAGTYNNLIGFTYGSYNGIASLATGSRITIAFDCDAKKCWMAKDGNWGSGNPSSGANPWVTWTGNFKIFPCFNLLFSTDGLTYMSTGASYLPSGFTQLA
jgi:hypothetical protein